ncbi:hypothetical protein [Floridanema flaviceps]|uniref:hypothetical protein n=1 Tax=Floridanema flaviceps TaxID=3396170 RepID=UPI0039A55757
MRIILDRTIALGQVTRHEVRSYIVDIKKRLFWVVIQKLIPAVLYLLTNSVRMFLFFGGDFWQVEAF